jgi:poly-gamma-glutamate capsule biosynthesis protein CapA/YwtB (metallophosphatase superfamily)
MLLRGVGDAAVRGLASLLVLGVTACGPTRTPGALSQIPPTPKAAAAPIDVFAPPPPRTFTVVGSGDVLLHDQLWTQASRDAAAQGRTGMDFGPIFASIKPVISAADLAICHMETPLATPEGPFRSYPMFNVPPQVTTALADLGYDSCSTASNHSLDYGIAGVLRTLDALDAVGIRHAGTARSEAEAISPTLLSANGVVVAHLSYTWSLNGMRRPADKPWIANLIDVDEILADARLARIAGAAVVIVSLHAGTEYQHAANSYQISLAKQLLASPDVDLILGAHVHVVQPLERIGDKWIAYGMGNQVAWQNQAYDTRDGIMPRFTFSEVSPGVFRVVKAEVIPTFMWLDGVPARLHDVSAVLASPDAPPAVRASCLASLRRTRNVIGQRGAFAQGLELVGAGAA